MLNQYIKKQSRTGKGLVRKDGCFFLGLSIHNGKMMTDSHWPLCSTKVTNAILLRKNYCTLSMYRDI